MDVITTRFQEDILKRMDKCIEENNFNSRTEFIREAVRDKLAEMSREDLIKELAKWRGKFKTKTSDAEMRRNREKALKELAKEEGWNIDL